MTRETRTRSRAGQRPDDAAGEAFAPAKRSLGQNFLVDPNMCGRIVASLGITAADTVLEIGPGRGALAGAIRDAGPAAYLALEKDRDLAVRLAQTYPGVAVAMTDALRLDWRRLDAITNLRLVGNLPYNIASPLLWDICSSATRFRRGVFMVQYEVAKRLTADPGTKAYGALTAWIANFARVTYCFKVPPTVFRPMPRVDSAVVAVTPLPAAERCADPPTLSRVLKWLFSMRRKQLGGLLRPFGDAALEAYLAAAGIDGRDRPEQLSPKQLEALSRQLKTRLAS